MQGCGMEAESQDLEQGARRIGSGPCSVPGITSEGLAESWPEGEGDLIRTCAGAGAGAGVNTKVEIDFGMMGISVPIDLQPKQLKQVTLAPLKQLKQVALVELLQLVVKAGHERPAEAHRPGQLELSKQAQKALTTIATAIQAGGDFTFASLTVLLAAGIALMQTLGSVDSGRFEGVFLFAYDAATVGALLSVGALSIMCLSGGIATPRVQKLLVVSFVAISVSLMFSGVFTLLQHARPRINITLVGVIVLFAIIVCSLS